MQNHERAVLLIFKYKKFVQVSTADHSLKSVLALACGKPYLCGDVLYGVLHFSQNPGTYRGEHPHFTPLFRQQGFPSSNSWNPSV